MDLTAAPLFTDVHPGPPGGAALWAITSDDRRIRLGHWPLEGARGTVLMFPGRTEYIEKYGGIGAEFAARGLSMLAVDWRGQGLSDRLAHDPLLGHVEAFIDYQKDVATMMRVARELSLPRPYFLVAHSMGGCIGLRAVMEGLGVQAAAFTGPMWGIYIKPHLRPFAVMMSKLMPAIGKGLALPPGTAREPYVLSAPFEGNQLTTDRHQFDVMQAQLTAYPEMSLGGPSFIWLREAFAETEHLASRAAPNLPAMTWVGSNERIVSVPKIHERMDGWTGGKLEIIEGGEHEVMLEQEHMRAPLFDGMEQLFFGSVNG
ncbi:MAG: alpha/beta hydrolase [Pseudomonadota bacterium]